MYIARVAKPATGSTLDLWLIENGSQNPKNNTAIAKCASTLNVFFLVFASLFRDVFMTVFLLLVNIFGRRSVCVVTEWRATAAFFGFVHAPRKVRAFSAVVEAFEGKFIVHHGRCLCLV